jgi:hypothetical protein
VQKKHSRHAPAQGAQQIQRRHAMELDNIMLTRQPIRQSGHSRSPRTPLDG